MIFEEEGGAGLRRLNLCYASALALFPCTAKLGGSSDK